MNDERDESHDSTDNKLIVRSHKLQSLQTFYKSLEDLAYIQLACLYYVDNSFILTILRASTIVNIIPQTSRHRLPLVLLVNAGCVFAHLFNGRPAPATNGSRMLSGGLLIDFCGEYAYTSKWKLVTLDLIALTIMLLLLLVANEVTKSKADAEKPTEILVDPRILEEGTQDGIETADSADENDTLLSEDTLTDLPRMVKISIADGLRDIVADPVSPDTDTETPGRNRETLRTLLTAVATRATTR